MNLIEVKCQQCSFASTAEDAVGVMQMALARGSGPALLDLKNIQVRYAPGEHADELFLNGITLETLRQHLLKEPTHALTVTLRGVDE